MATSKFLRLFLTNAAEPLLGATIYLVPQANTYPTGAILLTAHPTRAGIYEADGIAHGEYKIYIGSGTPALYTEHIWVGENFITIIADKFDVATGQLTTAGIKDLAVTTSKVVDNAITTGKIVNGAITTSKLGDGSIVATKFDPGAVTAFALDDGAVTESKIATGAVTETKVGTAAITATKIASNAVTSDKIINAAVTDSKIANGAVTELKLATDSVSTSKIVDDAVTKAKLNPNVIGVDGLLAQNVDGSLKVDVDGTSLGLGYSYQLSILDDGVDRSHINSNVAGAGLGQNLDGSLEVKTDSVSLEVVSDQVRLKRKEILGILQFSGGGRSFSSIYNSAGVTVSVTREDVGVYSFTASGSVFTASKTLSFIHNLLPDQVHIGVRRYSDTLIRIEAEDSSGAAVDLSGDFYLTVVVFP